MKTPDAHPSVLHCAESAACAEYRRVIARGRIMQRRQRLLTFILLPVAAGLCLLCWRILTH
jgi:hypothetical protein